MDVKEQGVMRRTVKLLSTLSFAVSLSTLIAYVSIELAPISIEKDVRSQKALPYIALLAAFSLFSMLHVFRSPKQRDAMQWTHFLLDTLIISAMARFLALI